MNVAAEIFLALGTILFILWWLSNKSKNKEFYKNIPGPTPLPLLGNALEFKSTSVLLETLIKYTKTYGEIVQVQIGPVRKFLLVSDYNFLEVIFNSTKLIEKSDDYLFFHPWLGTGLLTSDGQKWKQHRRFLTPAFHFQILEQFIDVFESCGNILIEKLENEANKDNLDVYPLVTLCTLDIICESTMGVSINAQNHENWDYVRSVKNMCRIVIERSMSPIEMYDFLYPLSKNYYTQKKSLEILHSFSNNVITKRREELKVKKEEHVEMNSFYSKKKKTFLDILLDVTVDGKPLTQEEIREEVDTFMFEGHDTTASAISFALYCLANNPKVQEQAYQEQKYIFGDNLINRNVTYTDLQSMKYLDLVIKETLRLYPSVPLMGRRTNEEVELNGTALPQGDTIVIFTYGIQRNPKYFDNPEEFNPSRFENSDGKMPYSHIPFSAGFRNCIGQKFAVLEMKSTISKILRKFELQSARPQHTLKLAAESILKSLNGIKIGLKQRNKLSRNYHKLMKM